MWWPIPEEYTICWNEKVGKNNLVEGGGSDLKNEGEFTIISSPSNSFRSLENWPHFIGLVFSEQFLFYSNHIIETLLCPISNILDISEK